MFYFLDFVFPCCVTGDILYYAPHLNIIHVIFLHMEEKKIYIADNVLQEKPIECQSCQKALVEQILRCLYSILYVKKKLIYCSHISENNAFF